DERVAWLGASVLVLLPLIFGLGGSTDTWVYYPEPWRPALQLWHSLVTAVGGVTGLIAFVFLFPDGRFAPRWASLVFGTFGIFILFSGVWLALGHDLYFELWLSVFIAALLFGGGAQLYRYRRLASPVEGQQIKWVVVSLALWVGSLPLIIFLPTFGAGS